MAPACADQSVDESATGVVGAEDVARQGDAGLRRVDRRDHFRIGLIAIVQNGNRVAELGRAPCYLLPGPLQRGQMITAPRWRDRRLGRETGRAILAHLIGASFHPIDAEYDVEDAAE